MCSTGGSGPDSGVRTFALSDAAGLRQMAWSQDGGMLTVSTEVRLARSFSMAASLFKCMRRTTVTTRAVSALPAVLMSYRMVVQKHISLPCLSFPFLSFKGIQLLDEVHAQAQEFKGLGNV